MLNMRSISWLAICFSVCLSGCGESGPAPAKLYPVSGKITVGGAGLDSYQVTFSPAVESDGASATTKADGTYSLTYHDGRPGCPPGKYKVVIKPGPAAMQAAMMNPGAQGPKAESKVPADFSKEVEVKAETNTIDIAI